MDASKNIVANNIRSYRNEEGISQEALAEIAGLHRTYISLVETGKRNLTVVNVFRIAKALGIEPYLLLIPDSLKKSKLKKN